MKKSTAKLWGFSKEKMDPPDPVKEPCPLCEKNIVWSGQMMCQECRDKIKKKE